MVHLRGLTLNSCRLRGQHQEKLLECAPGNFVLSNPPAPRLPLPAGPWTPREAEGAQDKVQPEGEREGRGARGLQHGAAPDVGSGPRGLHGAPHGAPRGPSLDACIRGTAPIRREEEPGQKSGRGSRATGHLAAGGRTAWWVPSQHSKGRAQPARATVGHDGSESQRVESTLRSRLTRGRLHSRGQVAAQ